MAGKIKISKHGLARCPGCNAHIRVAQQLEQTRCPFCQLDVATELLDSATVAKGSGSPLSRAILMASVLGLPFVGCTDSSPSVDVTTADVVDAGAETTDIPPVEDIIAQPPYGIPMDWDESPEDVQDTTGQDAVMPEDNLNQPAYGIPMDWEESPEDVQDVTVEDMVPPEDSLPQPPYGIPMDWVDEDAN